MSCHVREQARAAGLCSLRDEALCSPLCLPYLPAYLSVYLLASHQALAKHCASTLESVDISWCRGVSDDGAGLLADTCTRLHTLTIWGCSQLTQRFFHGHSNEELRIIGRGPTQ